MKKLRLVGLALAIALSFERLVWGDALEIEGLQRSNNYIRLTIDSDTSYYHQVWFTDSLTNTSWSVTSLLLGTSGSQFWTNTLGSNNFFYRVVSVPVSSPDDEDGDFLPDTYELEFGLDGLDDSDGGDDSDYDGFSNLEEYAAGTDPIIPYSAPTNAIYVDDDGDFTGTGTFIDPFPYIQWGIDAASTGYRVVVQPGIYDTPEDRNLEIDGKAIQVRGVAGAGLTIIDCKSLGAGFVIEDETTASVIDGFTIKNAINGGIYASNASPEVSNCIIKNNELGVELFDSSASFESSVFLNNTSNAVNVEAGSDVTFNNCTFSGNETNAVFCDVSSIVELQNNIIWSNGLDLRDVGDELVPQPTFSNQFNTTDSIWTGAGSQYTYYNQSYVLRREGSLYLQSTFTVETNTPYVLEVHADAFARLYLTQNGSGAYYFPTNGPAEHTFTPTGNTVTITINVLSIWAGSIYDGLSDVAFGTSISDIYLYPIRDTNDQCELSNNYTNDPQFIYDNYHLQNSSPCIDTGTTNTISDDVDQDQRETIDIGADEFSDGDADGLADWWEDENGNLDPSADTDGDGLTNLEEYQNGTDPNNSDTDADGINDGDEVHVYETDPTNEDSDNDGVNDGAELANATDPLTDTGDDDGDGLSNDAETAHSSNPNDGDTDGDGVGDAHDPSILAPNCFINITITNQIDEVPSTRINDGTGNADFKANIIFNPTAPTNSAGVQQVIIAGTVDDAFIVNGQYEHCWQMKGCLLAPWEYDITSEITDMTHGSFEIDVYDWIDSGWISNHVAFSAVAEVTYRIAVGPPPEISGDTIVCAGDTLQLTASSGTPPYSWSSSDETIATVDTNGLVTTLTNGTVTITLSDYYGCDDSVEINALTINLQADDAASGEFTVFEGNDDDPAIIINLENPKGFECGTTDIDDPCEAEDDPNALVVFYDEVTDGTGNIQPFDINLNVLPSTLENVTWGKVAGPNSGTLTQSDQPTAIFSSPTEGGLYQFESTADNISTRVNLLLPLAGADMSSWLETEIINLKTNAENHWHQTWVDNYENKPFTTPYGVYQTWNKVSGSEFDYLLDPVDTLQNAPCRKFQPPIAWGAKYGYVTVNGVVVHGSKINNMLWGLFGFYWGWPEDLLRAGAHLNQLGRTLRIDGEASQTAIGLGCEYGFKLLYYGAVDLYSDVLTASRLRELQVSGELNEEKLWPSPAAADSANSQLESVIPDLSTTP